MESFAETEVQKIQFNSQEFLAVLVASASILSLSGEAYSLIPSDLVILTFGVPLLFASAYEPSLIPGVLAYQLYSSLTYVLAFASSGWVFFLHSIVLWMSASKLWETTKGFQTFFQRQTVEEEGTTIENEEKEPIQPPYKYAGSILTVWGILISLRSFCSSAVDTAELLVGTLCWTLGGIQLCRHANTQLGLCLLVQLSAFIYGSLLILLIQYCVMGNIASNKVEYAAMLGVMAISVLLPLERFFSHASSLRTKNNNAPKQLDD